MERRVKFSGLTRSTAGAPTLNFNSLLGSNLPNCSTTVELTLSTADSTVHAYPRKVYPKSPNRLNTQSYAINSSITAS